MLIAVLLLLFHIGAISISSTVLPSIMLLLLLCYYCLILDEGNISFFIHAIFANHIILLSLGYYAITAIMLLSLCNQGLMLLCYYAIVLLCLYHQVSLYIIVCYCAITAIMLLYLCHSIIVGILLLMLLCYCGML